MENSFSLSKRANLSSALNILVKLNAIAKTFGLQKAIATFLLLAIKAYKKYLSPRKGFSCPYRVLYRGQSCSSYFYSCVSEQGLDTACTSFQQRLKHCQQAHAVLIASSKPQQSRNKKRRSNSTCEENNNCINCRDIFDLEFFLDVLSPSCNC